MRESDGFVNATKLCQAGGKEWYEYITNKSTKKFIKELQKSRPGIPGLENTSNFKVGIPTLENLIISTNGGNHDGTWVHHKVAVHLAAWISPAYAVAVADLVTRYTAGQVTTEESQTAAKAFAKKVKVVKDIKYTSNVSTLALKTGPLEEIDKPGVYFMRYGKNIYYDQANVPENALIIGFGHAKYNGVDRSHDHQLSTGPEAIVLDYVATPFYERCEKQLENRLKVTSKIVMGTIDGVKGIMREQFWVLSKEEYDEAVASVRMDAESLRFENSFQNSNNELLIEQEKTKQTESTNAVALAIETTKQTESTNAVALAIETTKQAHLEFEILKFKVENGLKV